VGRHKNTKSTPLFKELEILTVPCIYILNLIMFRKQLPEYYKYNESIHNCNTRNKSKSVVPTLYKL
jgi:hypothetical protein